MCRAARDYRQLPDPESLPEEDYFPEKEALPCIKRGISLRGRSIMGWCGSVSRVCSNPACLLF